MDMTKNDINIFEMTALEEVAKATIDDAWSTYLGALFDAGVAIPEPTAIQMDQAKESIFLSGKGADFVRMVVLGFGDSIKRQVGEPPLSFPAVRPRPSGRGYKAALV